VLVGTKKGKVIAIKVDGKDHKTLLQTKAGSIFGEVSSLSVSDNNMNFMVGS